MRYFREDIRDAYAALGLAESTKFADVNKARRRLVAQCHPDLFMHNNLQRQMAEERLKEINGAFVLLEHFLSSGRRLDDIPYRWPTTEGARRGRNRYRTWRYLRAPRIPWWKYGEFAFAQPDFFGPSQWYQVKKFAIGTAALTLLCSFPLALDTIIPLVPDWSGYLPDRIDYLPEFAIPSWLPHVGRIAFIMFVIRLLD